MKANKSTLGTCIRTLRKHNHMTQSQLADALGVTDKAVSKWERDISFPDITLFPKLAELLGVTLNDFLKDCGEEEFGPSRFLQAAEVSRDIRLPLHIILGYVEMARHNYDDPRLLLRYLDNIQVSGEYLMLLLDRMVEKDSEAGSEGNRKLPLSPEDLDDYLHSGTDAKAGGQEEYDFSGKRILIVDDMAVNREIAAGLLQQTGAMTDTAEDGLVCLDKIRENPSGFYDLILMDVMMPNMDGLEAARSIRQLPDQEKARIPIIALTTNVSAEDREKAADAGMNGFAEKPILTEHFLAMMNRFLWGQPD